MNPATGTYQAAPGALKDRVILISGAGSGIGRAIAQTCAQYGASAILLGKRTKPLEQTHDLISEAGGAAPWIVPLDLARASPPQYRELADKLDAEFGRLDGLVHNAARFDGLMPFADVSAQSWFGTLQVNAGGPYLMTQALLPLLQLSDAGRLVFTLEDLDQVGRAHWGAYGVSKFAQEGLFRIIADELDGSSVTCCAVRPGPTRTDLRARAWAAEDPETLPVPKARARAYVRLLDPGQRPAAGQIIAADH